MKTLLNIGCGREYRDGFVNIDNQVMYNGDFKVDMNADFFTLKWKKNSVDGILASHIAQYIAPDKMETLLKRWYGWLKEGGYLIVEAGDIIEVCKHIINSKTVEEMNDKNGIMQLYGVDDKIWNKWAWCPESMVNALGKAGFKNLKLTKGFYHHNPERDFAIQGTK